MPAPEELQALIKNFENQIDDLKSKDYKELSLCTDYLNPFFKLLGWDVDNVAGKSEKFRDVTQQFRLTIGGSSKAPDYLFKIGNTGVFLVEAKKPSVDLEKAKEPSFQLRRYGWNMKEIDVSILSDFETLFVYDCRIKPSADDEPYVGRVAKYTYKDYLTHWDEIESIFSRTNVEKGSLDKLLKEKNVKGVKESVDESFLKMIEEWRELLAKNIALRNENLGVRELNFAVQQTIDRIIFLRIAEDRGLELPGQLLGYTNTANIYGNLLKLYENADSRYNSGLFHFKAEKGIDTPPDTISMSLSIDDKVLKDMITNLYYPKSPFDFSAMPADILGQVYERFLGKVIRLTSSHQAKVEEKPEVRKAGGVYYTPTYIVDYIVQNTLGKLVEGKTPDQVAKLRILDPACGSGSFLIGAYQFLLDWHLDWYLANDRDKWIKAKNPPICEQMSDNQRIFRLTTEKRKEILKNNIYGVDIDRQAVEVSKLNLLLKVLEQENNPDLFKHNQRALPDLGANIKCGNSLIGMDFHTNRLMEDEEKYRVNTMDWDSSFPTIIKYENYKKLALEEGFGFDAIIGNPPYIRIQAMKEWAPLEVEFYKTEYKSASKGNYDIYVVFVEKALQLLGKNGLIGFILPHKFFNSQYGESLRGIISKGKHLYKIVHFGDQQVFDNATTYTTLLFLSKPEKELVEIEKVTSLNDWISNKKSEKGDIESAKISSSEWNFSVGNIAFLLNKVLANFRLAAF
jgi:type I restriction-modification system DNA methylase subunit